MSFVFCFLKHWYLGNKVIINILWIIWFCSILGFRHRIYVSKSQLTSRYFVFWFTLDICFLIIGSNDERRTFQVSESAEWVPIAFSGASYLSPSGTSPGSSRMTLRKDYSKIQFILDRYVLWDFLSSLSEEWLVKQQNMCQESRVFIHTSTPHWKVTYCAMELCCGWIPGVSTGLRRCTIPSRSDNPAPPSTFIV